MKTTALLPCYTLNYFSGSAEPDRRQTAVLPLQCLALCFPQGSSDLERSVGGKHYAYARDLKGLMMVICGLATNPRMLEQLLHRRSLQQDVKQQHVILELMVVEWLNHVAAYIPDYLNMAAYVVDFNNLVDYLKVTDPDFAKVMDVEYLNKPMEEVGTLHHIHREWAHRVLWFPKMDTPM